MKKIFADACYWIGLLNPKDQYHQIAKQASTQLGPCRIITSEMVLVELLNGLSGLGEEKRKLAVRTIKSLENNANVEIVPQTSLQFRSAANRYEMRLDKDWGATDCASFLLMEQKGISEALTADRHFEQAGFKILLSEGK